MYLKKKQKQKLNVMYFFWKAFEDQNRKLLKFF